MHLKGRSHGGTKDKSLNLLSLSVPICEMGRGFLPMEILGRGGSLTSLPAWDQQGSMIPDPAEPESERKGRLILCVPWLGTTTPLPPAGRLEALPPSFGRTAGAGFSLSLTRG